MAGIAGGAIALIILLAFALWFAYKSGKKKAGAAVFPTSQVPPPQPYHGQGQVGGAQQYHGHGQVGGAQQYHGHVQVGGAPPPPPSTTVTPHHTGGTAPPMYPPNRPPVPAQHDPTATIPEKDADYTREELDGNPYHGVVHELAGAKLRDHK